MSAKGIFAQRIKELREGQGLGVNELARKLKIGQSSISQYELGQRTPNIDVCKMFADYFNVTCDYLIGLTDEKYKRA